MKHKHQAYSLYMAIWLMITALEIAVLTVLGERTTIIVTIYWLGLTFKYLADILFIRQEKKNHDETE